MVRSGFLQKLLQLPEVAPVLNAAAGGNPSVLAPSKMKILNV